jgi:hypothetical protein
VVQFTQDCRPGSFSAVPSGLIAVDNPTQDYPGFPVRCSGHVCVCGFLYGKPHEAQWLQRATQEIRVRPGLFSAVPVRQAQGRLFGTDRGGSHAPVMEIVSAIQIPAGATIQTGSYPQETFLAWAWVLLCGYGCDGPESCIGRSSLLEPWGNYAARTCSGLSLDARNHSVVAVPMKYGKRRSALHVPKF